MVNRAVSSSYGTFMRRLDGTDQPGGVGPLSLLVLGDPKRIADGRARATCNDHQLHPPHLHDFIVPPVPPLGLPKVPPPPPLVPKPIPMWSLPLAGNQKW